MAARGGNGWDGGRQKVMMPLLPLSPLPLVGLRTADLAVRPSTYRNPALGRQRGRPRRGTPTLWPRGRSRCRSPPPPFLAGDDGAVAHCDKRRRGQHPFVRRVRSPPCSPACVGRHAPQMWQRGQPQPEPVPMGAPYLHRLPNATDKQSSWRADKPLQVPRLCVSVPWCVSAKISILLSQCHSSRRFPRY